VEVKEEYQAGILSIFVALKNLDYTVYINRASENIRISKYHPKRDQVIMVKKTAKLNVWGIDCSSAAVLRAVIMFFFVVIRP
jgi:hypothetical protein